MWLTYVITASVLWGISYAAAERLLSRGFSPLTLFFWQSVLCCAAGAAILSVRGRMGLSTLSVKAETADWLWLALAAGTAACAAVLILSAVAARNAPVTALVEISYPLPTAFFCWLFFRESHLNWQIAAGAVLIYAGILVVMAGSAAK